MADNAPNAQTVILPYTGQRYYATMPNDGFLTTVHYKLWAAGGGGGGWDSYAGGQGAGGAYVEGVMYVRPGMFMEVFVGQGGGPGTGGSGAGGGYNGKSGTNYSGGRGGNSGPAGYSGSGGGGGGATLIRVNGDAIIIAGAGGGGPGAGQAGSANASSSLSLQNKFYASAVDQSKGVAGGDHPGDGGGGGGGGGGNAGGEGGAEGGGDVPGQPGNSGSNQQFFANPADIGIYQSGRIPGGVTDVDYPGGNVGYGGTATPGATQPGGNGHAVLTFYRSSGIFVKIGGEYKRVAHRTKTSSSFQHKTNSWVKIAGEWRPINSNVELQFLTDGNNWGDPGLARYIPPPPPPPYVYDGGGGWNDGGYSSDSGSSCGDGGGVGGGSGGSCGSGDY